MKKSNLFKKSTLVLLTGLLCLNVFAYTVGDTVECSNWYGDDNGLHGIADQPTLYVHCEDGVGYILPCGPNLYFCMERETCYFKEQVVRTGTYKY